MWAELQLWSVGAQGHRAFLLAGHFLNVEFSNPLPELWHVAKVGKQGAH